MNSSSYSKLFKTASAFKELVDSTYSNNELVELAVNARRNSELAGLVKIHGSPFNFEPIIEDVMDPPTSGFSSDCNEENEKNVRIHTLSYTEVKHLLMDTSIF